MLGSRGISGGGVRSAFLQVGLPCHPGRIARSPRARDPAGGGPPERRVHGVGVRSRGRRLRVVPRRAQELLDELVRVDHRALAAQLELAHALVDDLAREAHGFQPRAELALFHHALDSRASAGSGVADGKPPTRGSRSRFFFAS